MDVIPIDYYLECGKKCAENRITIGVCKVQLESPAIVIIDMANDYTTI